MRAGRRRRAGSPRIDDEQHRVAARERGLAGGWFLSNRRRRGEDRGHELRRILAAPSLDRHLARRRETEPAHDLRPGGAVSQSPERLIRGRRCRGARRFGTDLGLDGGPHLGERLLT